jgi:hypothetical protein
MKPECPQCHTELVRRIRPSGAAERFLNFLSIQSFRCQLCAHRYRSLTVGADHRAISPDQRQFERLPTHVRTIIIGSQGRSEDVITDLSMGGCTLHTTTPFSKGAFLHLNLNPPDHESTILVETAMVRSVRSECVGLQFLEFGEGHKERLARFVRSLLLTRQASPAMG